MKKQLPNILTYSRIAVIPALAAVFLLMNGVLANYICAGLFMFASITDFFDGYLARAWHANSSLGRFLDPIADKLLVATALMLLVSEHRADIIPAIAILCREILVSGLREFLAELRIGMPVSNLAKYKTAAQMVAIFLLLLGAPGAGALLGTVYSLGSIFLWVAAALTLITGYAYLKTGLKHLSAG
jgi:CDP-diacylglycerol--glycerol-3-phosphate 3-phosphatidyltransferase